MDGERKGRAASLHRRLGAVALAVGCLAAGLTTAGPASAAPVVGDVSPTSFAPPGTNGEPVRVRAPFELGWGLQVVTANGGPGVSLQAPRIQVRQQQWQFIRSTRQGWWLVRNRASGTCLSHYPATMTFFMHPCEQAGGPQLWQVVTVPPAPGQLPAWVCSAGGRDCRPVDPNTYQLKPMRNWDHVPVIEVVPQSAQ